MSGTDPGPPYVLGVDLDGVCGDYTDAFRSVVATELGVAEESLPLVRSWDFREWGLSVDQFEHLHQLAVVEHRILRSMPVIDGAAEALWRLSDIGVWRSEEHTSELQSRTNLVCRLLLEKKKKK
mgnify:CR=1 FL=1